MIRCLFSKQLEAIMARLRENSKNTGRVYSALLLDQSDQSSMMAVKTTIESWTSSWS